MTTKEQRIQEARLRMINRQRKEDEDVQNMFGLPIDREELTVDSHHSTRIRIYYSA